MPQSNRLSEAYLIIKKSGEIRLCEALATIRKGTVPQPTHKGVIIKIRAMKSKNLLDYSTDITFQKKVYNHSYALSRMYS